MWNKECLVCLLSTHFLFQYTLYNNLLKAIAIQTGRLTEKRVKSKTQDVRDGKLWYFYTWPSFFFSDHLHDKKHFKMKLCLANEQTSLHSKHRSPKFCTQKVRHSPQYAWEIRKRIFISTVWPTDHTNPSRKQRFSKTHLKSEEFKSAGFISPCGQKTFWKRRFLKTM